MQVRDLYCQRDEPLFEVAQETCFSHCFKHHGYAQCVSMQVLQNLGKLKVSQNPRTTPCLCGSQIFNILQTCLVKESLPLLIRHHPGLPIHPEYLTPNRADENIWRNQGRFLLVWQHDFQRGGGGGMTTILAYILHSSPFVMFACQS